MPPIVNVGDFIKIGLIAYAFIFAANYALTKAGLDQFKA
jgi:hypothetical protein